MKYHMKCVFEEFFTSEPRDGWWDSNQAASLCLFIKYDYGQNFCGKL